MLYDLLEPWSRPDQYELHEAVLLAHVFDRERTGLISLEQALQVTSAVRADCLAAGSHPTTYLQTF